MVDIHVFGFQGSLKNYRNLILQRLGYKTKMKILQQVKKTGRDVIPEVPDEIAIDMVDDLEFEFAQEVSLVFDKDPITKTL